MDAQTMMAFILYVLGNVAVSALRVKGYVKMVAYFALMFIGFMMVSSNNMGELAYLVVGLVPTILFLGDMLRR